MAPTKNTSFSRALTLNMLLLFHILLLVALTFSILASNPDLRTKMYAKFSDGNAKSTFTYITPVYN
ncbi:hypothetical protein IFR05_013935, partial [Cadophora sp. M221]